MLNLLSSLAMAGYAAYLSYLLGGVVALPSFSPAVAGSLVLAGALALLPKARRALHAWRMQPILQKQFDRKLDHLLSQL